VSLVNVVYMFANVVSTNPIEINLVLWVVHFHGVITIVVIQVKDDFYHD
jgi:hypothetical protein